MNNKLTRIMKDLIVRLGAVDTGNMLRNTSVEITDDGITIHSVHYFNHVDNYYDIVNKYINKGEVIEILEEDIITKIEDNI